MLRDVTGNAQPTSTRANSQTPPQGVARFILLLDVKGGGLAGGPGLSGRPRWPRWPRWPGLSVRSCWPRWPRRPCRPRWWMDIVGVEGEIDSRALAHLALGPGAASVPFDDLPNAGEANARAGEFLSRVQPPEW